MVRSICISGAVWNEILNSINQSIIEAYGTPKVGYVYPEELPIAKKLRSHIKL